MGRSIRNRVGALGAWFGSGPTLGGRMEAAGRASGFDYLRLALAVLILVFHAIAQQSPKTPFTTFMLLGPGTVVRDTIVPMFFGLGGFLVAGSLDRTKSLVTYLGLRVLRIFPALWVDILFAALVLGPLLTTLPLREYFTHPEFGVYFLNLIGEIHYLLPGVFKDNPNPLVNGQLWTVPWDLGSYIALSVFTLLGFYGRRRRFFLLACAAQVAFPAVYAFLRYFHGYSTGTFHLVVVPCFLAGVLFHLYRDQIRWNARLFCLSLAVITLAMLIDRRLILLLTFPMLYVTVYLGAFNPKRHWIISSGDYSYGLFLYHRQFQQALWLLVPFATTWYGNLLLSAPLSLAAAFLSWHLVEKFALSQKHRLLAADERFAASIPAMVISHPPEARRP